MLNANTYLENLLKKLNFSDVEHDKIKASLDYLKQKIWSAFQNKLENVELFGSFDRGTSLPGSVDRFSDVDVMIIFRENEFQPQTYLNQLRSFGEKTYPRSETFPDHPTVVVELSHVRFELVPAHVEVGFWGGKTIKIPGTPAKELQWIETDPGAFKTVLLEKNEEKKGLTIPTIKLLKYWNAINNYPFRPYTIEKIAVDENVSGANLKECLYDFSDELSKYEKSAEGEKGFRLLAERIRRLKVLEKENIPEYIEQEMAAFLPMP